MDDALRDGPIKRARLDAYVSNDLLAYQFLLPLVTLYLTDRNVLTRLLPTCRSIKQYLPQYMLKRWIRPHIAQVLHGPSRYFDVCVTGLIHVTDQDLSVYPHLRYVHFDDDHRGHINVPDWVTHLQLPDQWDQPLATDMFPANLDSLIFGNGFNQFIEPGMLPSSIMQMVLGEEFDKPLVAGSLPASLVHMSIQSERGQPIEPDAFPPTLESLSMLRWDNDLEPGVLPHQLKHLELPMLDRIVPGLLPDSVEHLHVDSFDTPLPRRLTHLTIDTPNTLRIPRDHFPASLTHLVIGASCDPPESPIDDDEIPSTITHLVLNHRAWPEAIPMSVTHLQLTQTFAASDLQIGTIPSSVTHLTFGDEFNQTLLPDVIPSSVKVLDLGGFNKPISYGVIPNSVEDLTFGTDFNQVLHPGVIPHSVKKLRFLGAIRQQLHDATFLVQHPSDVRCSGCPDRCQPIHVTVGSIPLSVTELQCFWPHNVHVPVGTIPKSVTKLILGRPVDNVSWSSFDHLSPPEQHLYRDSIPFSVIELELGYAYRTPIADDVIPASVKHLKLGMSYRHRLPAICNNGMNVYLSDECRPTQPNRSQIQYPYKRTYTHLVSTYPMNHWP